jgi:hypothetical protein
LARVRQSSDVTKLLVVSAVIAAPLALSLLVVADRDDLPLVGALFVVLGAITFCVLGLPEVWRRRHRTG